MSYLSVSQTAEKMGYLNPTYTDFVWRGTYTGRNADRCVLGHPK